MRSLAESILNRQNQVNKNREEANKIVAMQEYSKRALEFCEAALKLIKSEGFEFLLYNQNTRNLEKAIDKLDRNDQMIYFTKVQELDNFKNSERIDFYRKIIKLYNDYGFEAKERKETSTITSALVFDRKKIRPETLPSGQDFYIPSFQSEKHLRIDSNSRKKQVSNQIQLNTFKSDIHDQIMNMIVKIFS